MDGKSIYKSFMRSSTFMKYIMENLPSQQKKCIRSWGGNSWNCRQCGRMHGVSLIILEGGTSESSDPKLTSMCCFLFLRFSIRQGFTTWAESGLDSLGCVLIMGFCPILSASIKKKCRHGRILIRLKKVSNPVFCNKMAVTGDCYVYWNKLILIYF